MTKLQVGSNDTTSSSFMTNPTQRGACQACQWCADACAHDWWGELLEVRGMEPVAWCCIGDHSDRSWVVAKSTGATIVPYLPDPAAMIAPLPSPFYPGSPTGVVSVPSEHTSFVELSNKNRRFLSFCRLAMCTFLPLCILLSELYLHVDVTLDALVPLPLLSRVKHVRNWFSFCIVQNILYSTIF
jgi:hypothetical protein